MNIQVNHEGFLTNRNEWTEEVAMLLAKNLGITLSASHWQVIHFARRFYFEFDLIPPLRIFIKTLKEAEGMELGNSLKLHQLFGDPPLKNICLIAGLPKPKHCM